MPTFIKLVLTWKTQETKIFENKAEMEMEIDVQFTEVLQESSSVCTKGSG